MVWADSYLAKWSDYGALERYVAVGKTSVFIGRRRLPVFDASVFVLQSGLFGSRAKSLIHDKEDTDIGRYVI